MFLVYLFLPYSNTDYQCIIPGLPNELSIYWHQYPYPFGEAFCKIRSFLSESASYANVLTILIILIHPLILPREVPGHLAICRSLYVFPLSDLKRTLLVSSLCWLLFLIYYSQGGLNLYFQCSMCYCSKFYYKIK